MRKLVLLCVSFASAAWGGEVLLGHIIVTDGGTATNRTTGWAAYACPSNTTGGCFLLPVGPSAKITIQTDEGCFVGTDVAGCDAGNCLSLAANEKLPTSINGSKNLTGYAFNSDGGTAGTAVTYNGGWVAVSPPLGGAACHAKVFSRNGTE